MLMEVINQLIAWDHDLFFTLNGHYSNFWDAFMWIFSSKLIWIPVAASILYILFQDKKSEFLFILIGLVVTIVLCDQISSSVFKPMFERLRPSREFDGLVHIVNGYKGGKYGFVSSHAANAFGFALFSSLIFKFKPYTIIVFTWALINSYSRIYLGVHYPLDIICGALLGLLCASSVCIISNFLRKFYTGFMFKPILAPNVTSSGIQYKNMWIVISFLLLTVFFICIFSIEMTEFMA